MSDTQPKKAPPTQFELMRDEFQAFLSGFEARWGYTIKPIFQMSKIELTPPDNETAITTDNAPSTPDQTKAPEQKGATEPEPKAVSEAA